MCPVGYGRLICSNSMGDDFETFSCSRMARSDALPHLPGEAKRAATPLKTGIVPPELSTRDPCSRSFAEQWSPASTVRSTPPFDSQQSSPAAARPPSFRRLVEIDSGVDAKSVPLCGTSTTVQPKAISDPRGFLFSSSKGGRGNGFQQARAWFRRVRVAPTSSDSTPRDTAPPRVRVRPTERSRSPLGGRNGPRPLDPARARSRKEKSLDIIPAVRAPTATRARPRQVGTEVDIMVEIELGQALSLIHI